MHTPQPWQSAGFTSVTARSSWKTIALNGQRSLQIRQPEQRASSTVARIGSRAISRCWIRPRIRAAAAAPLATLAGMSRGPRAQPAAKTPSVIVATGSSFGWRSMIQPSELQVMPKRRADVVGVGRRLQTRREDDHVDRDPALPGGQGVLDLDDEPAVLGRLLRVADHVGHLGDPAADEDRALLLEPLVELVVALRRASACRCRTRRPSRRCARGPGGRTSGSACSRSPSSRGCSCGRGCRRSGRSRPGSAR